MVESAPYMAAVICGVAPLVGPINSIAARVISESRWSTARIPVVPVDSSPARTEGLVVKLDTLMTTAGSLL